MDRGHWIDASLMGLRVTKYGASTQLTVGTWIGVADAIPEVGVDWIPGRFFGVALWLNKEMPFARGGDSGALVKLLMDGKTIPLGMHCGSLEETSFFVYQGDVAEGLEATVGADLFFCA